MSEAGCRQASGFFFHKMLDVTWPADIPCAHSGQARNKNLGGSFMRRIPLIAAAWVLLISATAFAQEWIEYASQQDFFTVNFPSQPKVENITYTTEYGISLPGRVYSSADGPNRYSMTAIDFTEVAKMQAERIKKCLASGAYRDVCGDHLEGELRGAMDHARG